MKNLTYNPTSVSPPGATLSDLIEEKGISQKELSLRLGRSDKNLSQIVNGKAPITPDLALDLERVLGTPAHFWMVREARFQEWQSRKNVPEPTDEDLEWARSFTYPKMVELGWIAAASSAQDKFVCLLSFFGVANREAYVAWTESLTLQYRRSTTAGGKDHLIAAWLRRGEVLAAAAHADAYSEKLFAAAVEHARNLTCKTPTEFVPEIQEAFAKAGVVLLFVPELPGMGVSGATRWLTPSKALIQVTLRYKTNDHLWFTIFHEACHILRHQKRAVFLETKGNDSPEEMEANRFAADQLIPPTALRKFVAQGTFDPSSVEAFAGSIGICPGIVVGRLQREDLIEWNSLNHLKVRFEWETD